MIKTFSQSNKYSLLRKVRFLMTIKENYQTHQNICLRQRKKATVNLYGPNRIQVKL